MYRTGDLVRRKDNGQIEFLGRIDHQVKIRGHRIELAEIESVLCQHEGIKDSVVMARQDTPGDQRLVAYHINRNGAISASELREFLRVKLPEYMVPSAFVALKEFPLTPNGKVDRKSLPKPEQTESERNDAYVGPRTPTEEVLAGIWSEILGIKNIGVSQNFFESGGHSILATRVVSRVRDVFNIDLPLRSMFESPTVEGVATALVRHSNNANELENRAKLLLEVAKLSGPEVDSMLAQSPSQ